MTPTEPTEEHGDETATDDDDRERVTEPDTHREDDDDGEADGGDR